MDDVVEDLCAAVRRHETALRALSTAGHRVTSGEKQHLEHMLGYCEKWLRPLRADDALARCRAGSAHPSIRCTPRPATPIEQSLGAGNKPRVSRAS